MAIFDNGNNTLNGTDGNDTLTTGGWGRRTTPASQRASS